MELNGKIIVGLGDSLMRGQHLQPYEAWLALMGEQYGMEYHSHCISGTSVASSDITKGPPMWKRLRDEITYDHVDFFVLQGGANDCAHNVPIGVNDDNLGDFGDVTGEIPTFKGALNYIINTVKIRWPGVKLLLLTNYDRKFRVSDMGLRDEAYVDAMVELARYRGVAVVDNYHEIGLDLRNPKQAGCVTDYGWAATPDSHLSAAGHRWLMPVYAKKLTEL